MPFDFRRFDIYRKVPKDLTQPTYTGAIISICCCLFILFLFLSELTGFITTEVLFICILRGWSEGGRNERARRPICDAAGTPVPPSPCCHVTTVQECPKGIRSGAD